MCKVKCTRECTRRRWTGHNRCTTGHTQSAHECRHFPSCLAASGARRFAAAGCTESANTFTTKREAKDWASGVLEHQAHVTSPSSGSRRSQGAPPLADLIEKYQRDATLKVPGQDEGRDAGNVQARSLGKVKLSRRLNAAALRDFYDRRFGCRRWRRDDRGRPVDGVGRAEVGPPRPPAGPPEQLSAGCTREPATPGLENARQGTGARAHRRGARAPVRALEQRAPADPDAPAVPFRARRRHAPGGNHPPSDRGHRHNGRRLW